MSGFVLSGVDFYRVVPQSAFDRSGALNRPTDASGPGARLVESGAQPAQLRHQRSFEALDALRGLAAVAVLQYHFVSTYGGPHLAPHGYLAVDFFFGLSGFVLCHAYQSRLDGGLSTWKFLSTRLVRLYPMYLVGVLLGVVSVLRLRALHRWPVSLGECAIFLAYSLAFFPAPPGTSTFIKVSFPFDMPAWSLFCELVANVGHAAFLRRRRDGVLHAGLAVAAIALVLTIWGKGSADFGVYQRDTWRSLVRVAFSYLAGICVYRYWAKGTWRSVSSLLPACLLVLLLVVPVRPMLEPAYDVLVILLAFPALVFLGALATPTLRWRSVTTLLGTASYAVYVLHVPLLFFMDTTWRYLAHRTLAMTPLTGQLCFVMIVSAVSLALDAWYDIPVRKWLRSRLLR